MNKLLLGAIISICLVTCMVGCTTSKEVNGKQIEVIMEKDKWTEEDGNKIENSLNQQISREANHKYLVSKIYAVDNVEYDNLFDVIVMTKLVPKNMAIGEFEAYGHDKETVDFINSFNDVAKELNLSYKGAEFNFRIEDMMGTVLAYHDKTKNKMVLCFE